MRNIYLLLMENFVLLDAVGPLHVFDAANDVLARSDAPQAYRSGLYATSPGATTSSSGVALRTDALPVRAPSRRGTVMVIGGVSAYPSAEALLEKERLEAWLRRYAGHFERLTFVGQRAAELAHQAKSVHRFARGRSASEWTSVGTTKASATALAMVESDMGPAMAAAIANQLASALGFDSSQRLNTGLPRAMMDARVRRLHLWMSGRLTESMTIARMATHLTMTPRTFARFYRRATGATPAQSFARMRLDKACELIAADGASFKAVAHACGFSSEEVMRRAFVRHLHMSPKAYRQQLNQAIR